MNCSYLFLENKFLPVIKLILSIFLIFFSLPVKAQVKAHILKFPKPQQLFIPAEFYIENIIDSRKEQSMIANLFSADSPSETTSFNLKNGLRSALLEYVQEVVPQNHKLRPVIIRISSFYLGESAKGPRAVTGNFEIAFSFGLEKEGDFIKLIEYKSNGSYNRPVNEFSMAEKTLAKAVDASLIYFNTWMNSESKINDQLASNVRFNFKNYRNNENPDTLFYDPKHPMTLQDFKGKPENNSKYAGSVFSFFAVESHNELVDGIIQVDFNLKVYVVRDFCWIREFARDAYTLNHEQRHFDITRIISERFKQKLLKEKITVDNFEGIISFEYIASLRDLDKMQKLYDTETGHGTDTVMQKIWNERIENELRSFSFKDTAQAL